MSYFKSPNPPHPITTTIIIYPHPPLCIVFPYTSLPLHPILAFAQLSPALNQLPAFPRDPQTGQDTCPSPTPRPPSSCYPLCPGLPCPDKATWPGLSALITRPSCGQHCFATEFWINNGIVSLSFGVNGESIVNIYTLPAYDVYHGLHLLCNLANEYQSQGRCLRWPLTSN